MPRLAGLARRTPDRFGFGAISTVEVGGGQAPLTVILPMESLPMGLGGL